MILSLRTDNPKAEIGLFDKSGKQLRHRKWLADRQLAKELLKAIHDELTRAGGDWSDIEGLIVFKGPGSFTGLRIGLTVANTIAYANSCPIVAEEGEGWLANGLERLSVGDDDRLALPHYGAEFKLTPPRK